MHSQEALAAGEKAPARTIQLTAGALPETPQAPATSPANRHMTTEICARVPFQDFPNAGPG